MFPFVARKFDPLTSNQKKLPNTGMFGRGLDVSAQSHAGVSVKFKGVETWKDFVLGGLCSASPCSGEMWSWEVNSVTGTLKTAFFVVSV